jgi:glycine/D-amino acid oxidase-like deaminating enzyme
MRENLAKGVNLQTYTTVRAVTAGATEGTWTVATDRGDITTERVVHATNGYSAAVEPSLRGVIRPTPHMCNKVVPPPCFSGSKALQNSYAIMASGGALFSINPRCTADGIVLFGGSNPGQPELEDILEAHPKKCVDDGLSNLAMITDAVKDFTTANFEGWSEAVAAPGQMFDYQWSGIIGRSADGVPFVGALPNKPGQWICAGHHGHGMARIFTAAPALVKVMQGDSFASTGLPDVYEMTSERLERLRSATDFSKVAII